MALTVKGIARLAGPGRYRDKESRGLYLQVGPSGTKSWLLRFELNGRERFHGLGAYPDFSLKEARERARDARKLLTDGIDPIEHKAASLRAKADEARKQSAIPTFKEATERYFAVHGSRWRNAKHAKQFTNTLEAYAYPRLGRLRVADITTDDVRLALEPIWTKIPETAFRVRGRIESVLSWAIANRYREGPNPARWSDNLEHLLAARAQITKTNHHAALPFAELPAFMEELRKREGIAARALEFTILTAARTGEVTGARWDEVDLKEKIWVVPANRIKGGKEHRVPLSDRALEILRALPTEDGNDRIFLGNSAGTGLGNTALLTVLGKMGRNTTTHGFRSSFRDWCSETTNYPHNVAEMALAHVIGDKVEKAYRRGDLFEKRRKLMTEWARFCSKPVTATAKVVPLRRA